MRRFLVFACLAVPSVSQTIVIDDFTVPYTRTISTGTWVDFQTDPTLLTGERDVELRMTTGSNGPATLTIGNGQLNLATGPGGRTSALLEYDGIGDEVANTGEGHRLIHAINPISPFPDGTNKVRFHVLTSSNTVGFSISLYQNGIELFHNSRQHEAGVDYQIDVPLAPSAFAQCNALLIGIGVGAGDGHATLSRVELVPEPDMLWAMAAGSMMIVATRKIRERRNS